MKGDFSRLTFDPKKNYGTIRMQQGRVQLDADWNEQADITEHRIGTLFTDLIGLSGVPQGASTAVPHDFQLQTDGTDIKLQAGHMYVAGLLVENATTVSLIDQPNLPAVALPTTDGRYLAYVDVWQRLVTALEDPEIRDPALGGADTTVRTKNVWQVKLVPIDNNDDVIANTESILNQQAPARLGTGKMEARLRQATHTLDNRLYRVEIHDGGAPGRATFKWSQDNGAIAATVTQIHTATINNQSVTTITLSNAEMAVQSRFAPNQWIEFSNEALTLNGLPGIFAKLTAVGEHTLTIERWAPLTAEQQAVCGRNWPQKLGNQPIVRRWDSPGAVTLAVPTAHEGWLELEKGIEVKFEAGNTITYKTGDYWFIPTRHLTGQIDWPTAGPQLPRGIQHHYAPLAALTRTGETWTIQEDVRRLFSALTGGLLSKQGDTMTGSLRVGGDLHVDNNVGIGTTSPGEKFEVKGNALIGGSLTVDTDTLHVDSTNNRVGIGTTAPQSDLEIGSFDARDRYLTFNVDGGNRYRSGIKLWAWKENFGYSLEYDERHTTGNGLHIKRHDQNADGSTLMFFSGNGNIGIGLTDPGAKLEVSGNALISGTLMVDTDTLYVDSTNNRVGIGTTDPKAKLAVVGAASISDGFDYAASHNHMASGSLTIGSTTAHYGGGNKWTSNTSGLLLETLNNTEIAIHDANSRLASFMYYEGDTTNRFTIGRDMGWGTIAEIVLNGSLTVDTDTLYVDSTNNRVGIGTTAPQSDLEIGSFDESDRYVTLKVAGGNRYRSGIKLWAWKENFGYSLEYDERHTTGNGLHIKRHDQNADGSTLMFFSGNGNIGIGLTDPETQLDILQYTANKGIRLREATLGNPTNRYFDIAYEGQGTIRFYHQNGQGQFMAQDGHWRHNSDFSLKEDVSELRDILKRALQLKPVRFRWKVSQISDIGFIAQEVEQVFPEIVSSVKSQHEDGREVKGLPYAHFGVIAIAALKEMKEYYDKKIAVLERQLALVS